MVVSNLAEAVVAYCASEISPNTKKRRGRQGNLGSPLEEAEATLLLLLALAAGLALLAALLLLLGAAGLAVGLAAVLAASLAVGLTVSAGHLYTRGGENS